MAKTKEERRRELLRELNELEQGDSSEVKEAAEEVKAEGGTDKEAEAAAAKEARAQGLSDDDARKIAKMMVEEMKSEGVTVENDEQSDKQTGESKTEEKGDEEKREKDKSPDATHRWYR